MTVTRPAQVTSTPGRPDRFRRRTLFARLTPGGRLALILILALAAVAIIGPLVSHTDPYAAEAGRRLLPIGSDGHPLGTDAEGRDMLTRLMYGMRTSLIAAVTPVLLSLVIGVAVGLLAGLGGRIVNTIVMRLLDVTFAFPAVLLALFLATALGQGLRTTIIALTAVWIPPTARIAAGEIARIRELDFVTVARVSGAGPVSVALRQITPAILPGVLAWSTSLVGGSIAIVGGLGFVGLGAPSPQAELGSMIKDMQSAVYTDAVLALLPALVTLLLALLFPLFGDALGRALAGRRPS
ncbi:ABC transporter permease [Dactylosporangium sp. AC04546]|uniref:ABC transporter permease n=1 Tax=Dactylosporangium sp. AC04546 TaxID=2862460 RepID=UPI001EDE2082|nr:ABC transporter permease [Dactylosporangium sp. AC04546]WVK89025.1 ABC transporter permease [Dactylosporangium sp. AC04546]